MHVPVCDQRRTWLIGILRRIQPDARKLGIQIRVVQDPKREGPWATAKRCWFQGLREGATHHMVLQDDILPCVDFLPTILRILELLPDAPIAPFAMRKAITVARQADKSWATIRDGCWGPCFILPVALITDCLRTAESFPALGQNSDDTRISKWMILRNRPAWATVPCLVEHLGASQSLIGFNNKKRVARWYIGQDKSGLGIDWTKGLKDPVVA
jgi:hypothetical protein